MSKGFNLILLLTLVLCLNGALVQLDKQLVPVSDLTAYNFKALISGKVHNFNVQTYKSAGGYVT